MDVKHPRSDQPPKRAKFVPTVTDPPIEAFDPPKRGDSLPAALELYAGIDYGKRAIPRADPSATPLPKLTFPDTEAVTANLPATVGDDYQLSTDGRTRPAEALLFNSKGLAEMCELIQQGFTLQDISEWHGLPEGFLYNVYSFDRFGVRKAFDKAALECKLHHLKRVKDGSINYQSSTWFLERKFRAEYGKEETLNVRPAGQTKKTTWDLGDGKTIEFN